MAEPHSGDPDTRLAILEAAWVLFEERAADVTMAAVAERAGVSRQAVYLHFANRSSLLVSLVAHIDRSLGLDELSRPVRDAPTGREALEAMIVLHATYHARIIGVARLLDAARHTDAAVAAAWEDRMAGRRRAHHGIIQRLADDGELAEGWDVSSAALLLHSLTLPRVWDELVVERGWTPEEYRSHLTRLLTRALIGS